MEARISQILKEHHLRNTDCRKEILTVFMANPFAISHSYLEAALKEQHDRVTIYRTLYSFLDKGILHKVLDEGGSGKYALCSDHCSDHQHRHDHVHFKCSVCGQTNCLEEVVFPAFGLPEGYKSQEIGVLVQGICKKCNQHN